MKTYINKNNPSYIATQREDGNYKVTVGGKEHYTIKHKKDIEGSGEWLEMDYWFAETEEEFRKSFDMQMARLEDLMWGVFPRSTHYEGLFQDTPTKESKKKEKTDGILSVRVGGKKYKIGTPHKNSKIYSFFTNNGDIWVSLERGEQHKL